MSLSRLFETILALVKRSEPGTGFTIEKDTKTPTILTAISNGRITFENAVIRLCELVEDESDATAIAVLTRRLDCLKTACDIHHTSPARGVSSRRSSSRAFFVFCGHS